MIMYQADWVCPATSPPIRNGSLAAEGDRIAFVGAEDLPQAVETIVYPGCAIIPGFVNTHAHLELTLFHGLLDNLSFPDWIARLVRLKYQNCTQEALKVSAQLGVLEMLRAGITTVGEVMDVGTGWEAMLEFGLQGVAYQEVFGPAEAAAPEALRALQEKVKVHRRQETLTQRVGISPHAPYTVSKRLYESVRDYARHDGLRMTAHIAETRDETLFVQDGAGPFAEAHRKRSIDVVARGCPPVEYLGRLGLLGPDMLLVHAIETSSGDLDRIRESATHVVHCPKSNAYLGHRVAPVAAMRAQQIPVSLGTDSLASNEEFDMFAEMRMVSAQQHLDFDDLFRMATIDGARALGMEAHVGSLETGKRANFAVVALRDSNIDPTEAMIRLAKPADIKATFVNGSEKVFDSSKVQEDVRRIQHELRKADISIGLESRK
jgi:cytosine/adenosine deaminase-related metal-dependent hydrolase